MTPQREPNWYVWYCKCKKSTGKPIGVYNTCNKKLTWHSKLPKSMTNTMVSIEMAFDNAIPIAARSGATTILEVYLLDSCD
jgi:hypothetical protein